MVSRNAHILDSPIISTKITMLKLWAKTTSYVELISKYDPQRGSRDHMTPHSLHQNHPIPIQTKPSSQKRILVTISMDVMTVVHFAKVSTLYPRVVISLLAK
jgi:hypothetical protein